MLPVMFSSQSVRNNSIYVVEITMYSGYITSVLALKFIHSEMVPCLAVQIPIPTIDGGA